MSKQYSNLEDLDFFKPTPFKDGFKSGLKYGLIIVGTAIVQKTIKHLAQ